MVFMDTSNESALNSKLSECLAYIDRYWATIERAGNTQDVGTLIGLPKPYLVPNNGMFQELYYWDSYFLMRGLPYSGPSHLIRSITENCFYLLERFGRIPNASRFYFLSRSQPPFLSSMMRDTHQQMLRDQMPLVQILGWVAKYLPLLESEYNTVWCGTAFPDERCVFRGLSRYYDLNIWHAAAEAESGWDMTPRFQGECLDYLAIDLNCLLFKYENDIAYFYELLNDQKSAGQWLTRATNRKQAVCELMYDQETGFFYDYNFRKKIRGNFKSLAGLFALWSGLATLEQAQRIVSEVLPQFETEYGVVTTEKWQAKEGAEPKQWAWPNGWAPLQSIVVNGLLRYGFKIEALRIARKWNGLILKIFSESGKIYEKYNVVEGVRACSERYPDQVGFGWTNSVFVEFNQLLANVD